MGIFSKEEREFIKNNCVGNLTKDLTEMLNNEFGTSYTADQIRWFKKNNRLKSGVNTEFKKGQASFNKGLKQSDYMSKGAIEASMATRFKKGRSPHNTNKVGDEVERTDGYFYRKIAQPNVWKAVHHIVWEDYHGKPVPDGHFVIFLDLDRSNFNIENLKLVSQREHAILNKQNLRMQDRELTRTGVYIARLQLKISETARRSRNGEQEN